MAKKSIKESKETMDAALSVLVGIFRKENAEWIKEKKLYNLPLPPCGKVDVFVSSQRCPNVKIDASVINEELLKFKEAV